MRRTAWIAPTLMLPMLLAACAPDFTPMSFVDKPRILGVVAEPPEVAFSEQTQGDVALSAVIALPGPDPDGVAVDAELTDLSWSLCVLSLGASAGYRCAVPEFPVTDADFESRTATFQGAVLAAQMDLVRSFVGGFVEYLKQVVTQDDACNLAVIAEWDDCVADNDGNEAPCEDATFAAAKACMFEGGLEAMFHATATVVLDGEPVTLDAYKRVAFRAPKDGRIPNGNPGFRVRVGEAEVAATDRPNASVVSACPDAKVTFEPELFDDAIETNPDAEPNPDGTPAEEFVFLSWTATSGEFDRIKSSTAVLKPDDPIDLSNELVQWPADEMPAESTVWVFARDDRLGASFVTFTLTRWDGPECEADPDFVTVLAAGGAP
jgi:hypothetical protein